MLKRHLKALTNALFQREQRDLLERNLLATGRLLSNQVRAMNEIKSLADVEFRIFSQFGDDGIIQWLVHQLGIQQGTFVEFGVEDYTESNTRFLMMQDNWQGLVMDGSRDNVDKIKKSNYYWKHNVYAVHAFITRENINELIKTHCPDESIDLLHIDIDGMDYWILEALENLSAKILIVEFNSTISTTEALTVPYKADFDRNTAHHSNLYWGASLPAIQQLAKSRKYTYIGSNTAGNNAYFIKNTPNNTSLKKLTLAPQTHKKLYHETRDSNYNLLKTPHDLQHETIKHLPYHSTIIQTKSNSPNS